jgi:hypothetical protein
VFFGERLEDEGGEGVCEREELVLMCERVLFMKEMCENKEHGRKCV